MGGAVRPRVLAVAAAAAASLVALGGIATVAVWGFRNRTNGVSSGIEGWLVLVWTAVAVAVAIVGVVALAGIRSLRRPLQDLSRAADRLQAERLPAALREIEAGGRPAPSPGIGAPEELADVAGALENLERFVHYHATRAQRADRDLGGLLAGAADRAEARARVAEDIDLTRPASMAPGLHRDAGALRALVPDPITRSDARPGADDTVAGPGSSISDTVAAAAQTTLRPHAVAVGELQQAMVDAGVTGEVMVALGEVIDAAIGPDEVGVVHGSVQPEGYHFIFATTIGTRGPELAELAEALRDRDRDAGRLPFGLRAAVQAGRRARLVVWLTLTETSAQWHLLVPPESFVPTAAARESVLDLAVEPAATLDVNESLAITPSNGAAAPVEVARAEKSAAARSLGGELEDLLARLEAAIEGGGPAATKPAATMLDEAGRTALLVDGTSLVARLQQAELCSPRAQRALLRAIDAAVGGDRSLPLAGSARDRVPLPYEALAEVREHVRVDIGAPLP